MTQQCTFYIIRHGETDWNAQGILQGNIDNPLNEKGIQQAKEAANMLKRIHFDAIFSSELLRSRQTADIIALERKMEVITSRLLRERGFGILEGKDKSELAKIKEQFVHMTEDAIKKFKPVEGYESDEESVSRYMTFLREMALTYAGKTVLIVSHGGIMRALLIHLGVLSYEDARVTAVTNGGYAKIVSDGVAFWVEEMQGIVKG